MPTYVKRMVTRGQGKASARKSSIYGQLRALRAVAFWYLKSCCRKAVGVRFPPPAPASACPACLLNTLLAARLALAGVLGKAGPARACEPSPFTGYRIPEGAGAVPAPVVLWGGAVSGRLWSYGRSWRRNRGGCRGPGTMRTASDPMSEMPEMVLPFRIPCVSPCSNAAA